MPGQINRGSFLGDFLYKESQKESNKIFVETGTWNGQGSTWCILQGIIDSKRDDCYFYTLEINPNVFYEAIDFLPKVPNFFLMLGKITDETLVLEEQDESFFRDVDRATQEEWLNNEKILLKNSQTHFLRFLKI